MKIEQSCGQSLMRLSPVSYWPQNKIHEKNIYGSSFGSTRKDVSWKRIFVKLWAWIECLWETEIYLESTECYKKSHGGISNDIIFPTKMSMSKNCNELKVSSKLRFSGLFHFAFSRNPKWIALFRIFVFILTERDM